MSNIKMLLEQIRLEHLTFHKPYEEYDPMCKFCVEEREEEILETVASDPNHYDADAGEGEETIKLERD